jgi:hypothetical protein
MDIIIGTLWVYTLTGDIPGAIRFTFLNKKLEGVAVGYNTNTEFFDVIDTEEKAYWLGYIAGDGCITNGAVTLAAVHTDAEHVKRFGEALGGNQPVTIVKNNGYGEDLARIVICSVDLSRALQKHFQGRTKDERTLPDVPDHLVRHFVRGFYEADGGSYVYNRKGYQTFTLAITSPLHLMEDLLDLIIVSYGFVKGRLRPYKTRNSCDLRFTRKKEVKGLLEWMYSGAEITLERKREQAERVLSAIC